MVRIAIAVWLGGCSSPPPPLPPQVVPPPAAPVAPAPLAWVVEVVAAKPDTEANLSIFARPEGIAILGAFDSPTSTWVHHDGHGSTLAPASTLETAAAAFDASGTPWLLGATRDDVLELEHAGTTEIVAHGFDIHDERAGLAFDKSGAPHICIASEQAKKSHRAANAVLSYATRVDGTWREESVPGHARGCTIAIADDGVAYFGTEDGVAWKSGAAWTAESFGGHTAVARAPDGTIVAVAGHKRALVVARLHDGVWSSATMLRNVGGELYKLAFAIDSHGLVHAVFEALPFKQESEIRYVVEGSPVVSTIVVADGLNGLAIALDAHDSPHVVVAPGLAKQGNQTVKYARLTR
jgi:hypothetical protein